MGKDWAGLHRDIVAKIAEHIELYDDYEAFSEVCSNWRLAIKECPHKYYINKTNTQLPLLTLVDPDNCSYRRLYSLTKRKFLRVDLPSLVKQEDDQTMRYFSSHGWLIAVSRTSGRVTLFNPFAGDDSNVVELPRLPPDLFSHSLWNNLLKFVLSCCPSKANNNDYMVAAIIGDPIQLAVWRPGQDGWSKPKPKSFSEGDIHDVCFFGGELYAIKMDGKLVSYGDLDDPNKRPPRVVADFLHRLCFVFDNVYIMELKPECEFEERISHLLVLQKKVFNQQLEYIDQPSKYKTTWFKVWMVNVENGKIEQLKSLGNQAIFVGFNSTFSVKAYGDVNDESGVCKANCIYFTDDNFQLYQLFRKKEGGRDMGIYSLAHDKHIHYRNPFYRGPSRFSRINPPTWLEFPTA